MRIWLDFVYSVQTPRVRSVVLYRSCLTGGIHKPLQLKTQGAQHKGRGQAQQGWAGELKPPGLWMENHNSRNIYLDTSDSCRVDDGESGGKKISIYQRTV